MNKKDILIEMIMENNSHQFIYGYKGEERTQFLTKMAEKYPITIDNKQPIGLYINGLSNLVNNKENQTDKKLAILAEQFCYYSILSDLMTGTIEQVNEELSKEKTEQFLGRVNKVYLGRYQRKVANLQELKNLLEKIRKVFCDDYEKCLYDDNATPDFIKNEIPYMLLIPFIQSYKEMINNDSYIAVIVDQQSEIPLELQRAFNSLVGSRINADISTKIVSEAAAWQTYSDLGGNMIERTHDYFTVEIDSNHEEYMKVLKKNYKD